MEVKKNLNNVQRKMLDQIYTEQFEKRSRIITEDRAAGLKKLQSRLLKETLKDKDVKRMVEAGKTFYQLQEQLKARLGASNVTVSNRISGEPQLEIGYRYGYNGSGDDFPEVTAYNAETRQVELRLSEKKKEMRAKIYGVAASYEEVDSEIKELLKDV